MPYCTQQEVQEEIGGWNRVQEALDDSGTGNQVELTARLGNLMARASAAVDAFLQGRYITPLSPVPAIAVEASIIFTAEILYGRRRQSTDEKNPYTARANDLRDRLKRIADRKESLDALERPAFTPGAVLSKPSSLNGSSL
jgi:hypothetical protein